MSSATKCSEITGKISILDPLKIKEWDSLISHLPSATFFHSAAWARVLNRTYGYQPLYFAAKGEHHRIGALLPMMEVDSWLTGKRGIGLPFADECEPLGGEFVSLFEKAQDYGAKNGWKYLECRGGRARLDNAPASKSYFNHQLQLEADENALFAKFESSVRRAVRKAEQNKLTVEFSQSPAAVRDFYRLFCKTRQRHGVPLQPFPFFANIQQQILEQNQGWVVLARHGLEPVAGAIFFHYNKSVIFKFGASNEAFQHLRGNNLVLWEAIRRYAREGFTSLDFGRTALENEGLRRFKLGWGTRERTIDYVSFNLRTGNFVQPAKKTTFHFPALNKLIPVPVLRLIGLLFYKHIAMLSVSFDWNQLSNCF